MAKCPEMSEEERTKAFSSGFRAEWRMAIAGWEPARMVDAINKPVSVEEVWNETSRSYRKCSPAGRNEEPNNANRTPFPVFQRQPQAPHEGT